MSDVKSSVRPVISKDFFEHKLLDYRDQITSLVELNGKADSTAPSLYLLLHQYELLERLYHEIKDNLPSSS